MWSMAVAVAITIAIAIAIGDRRPASTPPQSGWPALATVAIAVPFAVAISVESHWERHGGNSWLDFHDESHGAAGAHNVRKGRQRLCRHLVHVVITIGGEAPDEMDSARLFRERLIFAVQFSVLRARNWVIRITLRPRKFINDAGLG